MLFENVYGNSEKDTSDNTANNNSVVWVRLKVCRKISTKNGESLFNAGVASSGKTAKLSFGYDLIGIICGRI